MKKNIFYYKDDNKYNNSINLINYNKIINNKIYFSELIFNDDHMYIKINYDNLKIYIKHDIENNKYIINNNIIKFNNFEFIQKLEKYIKENGLNIISKWFNNVNIIYVPYHDNDNISMKVYDNIKLYNFKNISDINGNISLIIELYGLWISKKNDDTILFGIYFKLYSIENN
jgi:hypothetical protein